MSSMREARPALGFIGAGKVGSALALALADAGYAVVAVASSKLAAARALAARIEGCAAAADPQSVVDRADIVFVTTPAAAIRKVASERRWRPGVAVVHTSGSEGRDALAAAAAAGAATASLHPLLAFAEVEAARRGLRGAFFAVEAEGPLAERLNALVADLGGTPLAVRGADKALYHAAAVFAGNYVLALLKLASDLWLNLGFDRELAVSALLPLMRGALANAEGQGLAAALSGPIARGDAATVQRHIEALAATSGSMALLDAYRCLGRATLPLAAEGGGLTPAAATALRDLLSAPDPSLERKQTKA